MIQINEMILNKKLISSDIFDTLLFRTVAKPRDIFTLVSREYERIFCEELDYDYTYVREFAEAEARKKESTREVYLEDIIKQLPYHDVIKSRLAELEFNIEKKSLVLNDELHRLLIECKQQGLIVTLVSDMYYSKNQMMDILVSVGCDISIFDEILMSSDYKASKANRQLYQNLKHHYSSISPDQILHIGDNYGTDIIAARKEGIEAMHYTKYSERLDSVFALEEAWGGETVPELRNLRKTAPYVGAQYEDIEMRYYQLGFQVFGPVYSLYAEWVIDYAINEDINKICPLAGENNVFVQMFQILINKRGLNIEVLNRKTLQTFEFCQDCDEPIITVDLTGREFIKCQKGNPLNKSIQLHHLMMISNVNVLSNVMKGHHIVSWLGYDDQRHYKIGTIYESIKVIEAATHTDKTVIDYECNGSSDLFITATNEYQSELSKNKHILCSGILEFQIEWIKLDDKKSMKEAIVHKKEEFLNILYRLINYPLQNEVSLLNTMLLDQYSTYWPQGAIAHNKPEFFLLRYIKEHRLSAVYNQILLMIAHIETGSFKKICIYGAGELGRDIQMFAELHGIRIHAFIDRSYAQTKEFEYSIPVRSIQYLDESVDLIIIGSNAFYSEIEKTIEEHYCYTQQQAPQIIRLGQ
ncbi:HAD hydrolase-like protein [Paenibacillus sp. strain BS8-2]